MQDAEDAGGNRRPGAGTPPASRNADSLGPDFLSTLSREIRTPLNGIQGILQLLRKTPLNPEQTHLLRVGLDTAKGLARLLTDILDLAGLDANPAVARREPFRPADIRDAVVELFAEAAADKGLRLEITLDDHLPACLLGDEARLRQILFNLMACAVAGTQTGLVRLAMSPVSPPGEEGVRILFSVQDTGPGIPEALQTDLFEPFAAWRDQAGAKYGRSGLSLSFVRRLVDLLGGAMSFESTPGEGTTCHVSLPFGLPAEVSLPKSEPRPRPAAAPAPSKPAPGKTDSSGRVLLVEDDPVNQIILKKMIEKAGYSVNTAGDGRQALDLLPLHQYRCVVMDVHMPVMDGQEATRRIRAGEAGERFRRIPIIALTAHAMQGDRERIIAAGMDDYLAKPVDMDLLRQAIDKAMASH